jgi:hypothetical protein
MDAIVDPQVIYIGRFDLGGNQSPAFAGNIELLPSTV